MRNYFMLVVATILIFLSSCQKDSERWLKVYGIVTDETTNEAISNCKIDVWYTDDDDRFISDTYFSDSSGHYYVKYEILLLDPDCGYILEFQKNGYIAHEVAFCSGPKERYNVVLKKQ